MARIVRVGISRGGRRCERRAVSCEQHALSSVRFLVLAGRTALSGFRLHGFYSRRLFRYDGFLRFCSRSHGAGSFLFLCGMARRKLSRSANCGRRRLRRGLVVVNHRRSISCQFLCGGNSSSEGVANFASEFLDRSAFLRDAFHAPSKLSRVSSANRSACYTRPERARTTTISRTNPNPPLG